MKVRGYHGLLKLKHVFLLQILCLAIFFAFFCRKSNDDKEADEYLDENQINLDADEEYLHSIKVCFGGIFPLEKNRSL